MVLERRQLYNLMGATQSDELARQALKTLAFGDMPQAMVPDLVRSESTRHPELALDFAIEVRLHFLANGV